MDAQAGKNIRLRIIIAALLFVSFVTGGILIVDIRDFGPATRHRLAEKSVADIWLQPHVREIGSPLLFIYKRYDGPYALDFRNWDGGGLYKSLDVSSVTVTYADGKADHPGAKAVNVNFTRADGMRRARTLTTVPGAVALHADNKIEVTGTLTRRDGTKVPFSLSLEFKAQRRTGFAPYWIALATE